MRPLRGPDRIRGTARRGAYIVSGRCIAVSLLTLRPFTIHTIICRVPPEHCIIRRVPCL